MIIYHEGLDTETRETARELHERLAIPTRCVPGDLEPVVRYTPNRGIYMFLQRGRGRERGFSRIFPGVKHIPTLVYTGRDLYDRDVPFDPGTTWIYGYDEGGPNLMVVSSARLKGIDSKQPRQHLHRGVPRELYIKRMVPSAFTMLGHKIVKGGHLQEASYVNDEMGLNEPLGPHCPDPDCLMSPVIDLRAPANGHEYALIGGEKRFNAGNDDQLERLYDEWFCPTCRGAMQIGEEFYRT